MKLFKGVLAIAIVSLLFVSCKEVKKGADAVKDGVENVANKTADVAKGAANTVKDGADKTADAVKGAAKDAKDAVTGKSSCEPGCKKACCADKAEHKCDATCKEKGCTHKDAKAHVCDDNCKKNGCSEHKDDHEGHKH